MIAPATWGAWGTSGGALVVAVGTLVGSSRRERRLRAEAVTLIDQKADKARAEEAIALVDRYRQETARVDGLLEACEKRAASLQAQVNDLYLQLGKVQGRANA